MYQFLFRSRWFALAWALMMTVSAVLFTTTGAGAVLTGTSPKQSASGSAADKQSAARLGAEDDHAEDAGSEPVHLDTGSDSNSHDLDGDARYNTAPFAASDDTGGDTGLGR